MQKMGSSELLGDVTFNLNSDLDKRKVIESYFQREIDIKIHILEVPLIFQKMRRK